MKKIVTAIAMIAMFAGSAFATEEVRGEIDGSLNTNNNNYANNSHNSETTHNGDLVNQTGGTQIIHQAGGHSTNTTTQKIESNQAAPVYAPGLVTGGQDVCLGSTTGGFSLAGFGFSGGKTVADENCEMLKQVKLLGTLGLKDAAVCVMFNSDETIRKSIVAAYPQLGELCDAELKAAAETAKEIQDARDAQAERDRIALESFAETEAIKAAAEAEAAVIAAKTAAKIAEDKQKLEYMDMIENLEMEIDELVDRIQSYNNMYNPKPFKKLIERAEKKIERITRKIEFLESKIYG